VSTAKNAVVLNQDTPMKAHRLIESADFAPRGLCSLYRLARHSGTLIDSSASMTWVVVVWVDLKAGRRTRGMIGIRIADACAAFTFARPRAIRVVLANPLHIMAVEQVCMLK
jgi:hypothetical protein